MVFAFNVLEPARVIALEELILIAWLVALCCFAGIGVATMTISSYLPTLAELKNHDFQFVSELSCPCLRKHFK